MKKLAMAIAAATWLVFSPATFAQPAGVAVTRFEFADYEGEGVFNMYRLDVNLKTRQVKFCFLNSDAVERDVPADLAGIIYRGGTWTGHFDFDHAEGKGCFDTKLAVGQNWFSSATPVHYGDGEEYQFFFVGDIKPMPGQSGAYRLDGTLSVFIQKESMDMGSRVYARQIVLNEKNVGSHTLRPRELR